MNSSKFLTIILLITFWSCKKDEKEPPVYTHDKIIGNSQKGPFVNGSSLTLFELDANYAQSGNSFNTQILDNSGAFEISNINVVSNYVKLKADGFYFNEVSNANSLAPITLYAFSDLSNKSTVNVNILTNLEVSRMEYLLNNGMNFNDAKTQAQQEILNIFSIVKPNMIESELLNISQNGDDNAILLAISIIIQGYKTEAQLTQLLGDMATDIRTDGILNSQVLGTTLVNDVRLMNLASIRANIETKYLAMGVNATIPNFENYINIFLDSTSYTYNNFIEYPYILDSKENLLSDTSFYVTGGVQYSTGAFLPFGSSLKIVIKATPGFNMSGVGTFDLQNAGWIINHYSPDSIVLNANGINQTVNVPMMFGPPTSTDYLIYENNATTPTRIKTILN